MAPYGFPTNAISLMSSVPNPVQSNRTETDAKSTTLRIARSSYALKILFNSCMFYQICQMTWLNGYSLIAS